MSNFISVNTKMNFDFKVEESTIYEAINHFFKNQNNIVLISEPRIVINESKKNIDIFIKYKLKKNSILSFETKKMIFMLEERIYSLINVKPNNINVIFEGIENV
ncbi:MMB_0454 family protein [Metamycoplasma gateae]|uniref:Asp23/Gls24 family envelope stress response protein n=1 Tax=Metamycoplasma gateae TaxID=35769 RepID=A0ABZ2AN51_9BACT|nr:hypothetical protein V2E26_01110 [Metamycoplasma gateae]